MSTSVKAYYARAGRSDDVRRFALEPPLSHATLVAKVGALFGLEDPAMTWKDEDGDAITIGHTDDLIEAARSCPGTLKIYVSGAAVSLSADTSDGASDGWEQVESTTGPTEEVQPGPVTTIEDRVSSAPISATATPETSELATDNSDATQADSSTKDESKAIEDVVHTRVQCDITGQFPIKGNRWRKIGHDYDLCEEAFQALDDAEKSMFELIRSPGSQPEPYAPDAAEAYTTASANLPVHLGVTCDKSGMSPIVGNRWHLIGYNYDLCQTEFEKLSQEEQGRFELIAKPGDRPKRHGYPVRFTRDGDPAQQAAQLLRTVLAALQENYSVEIDLVPRDDPNAAHHEGPVQAEVPIRINTTSAGDVKVEVENAVGADFVGGPDYVSTACAAAAAAAEALNAACNATSPKNGDVEDSDAGDRCHRRCFGQKHRGHFKGDCQRRKVPTGDVLPDAPIHKGMCGEGVRQLQAVLFQLGLLNKSTFGHRWQGFFGPRTAGALRAFQIANGLSAEGVFNDATRAALLELLSSFESFPTPASASESGNDKRTEIVNEVPAPVATAPPEAMATADDQPTQEEAKETPNVPVKEASKWEVELVMLRSMGFDNAELLVPLLEKKNGHIDAVVAAILD